MAYRVALITGAASGIGRTLAMELASKGTAIAAIDVAETGLVSLAKEFDSKKYRLAWRIADVTDAYVLATKTTELEAELGTPIYDSVSVGVWKSLRLAGIATQPGHRWGSAFAEMS